MCIHVYETYCICRASRPIGGVTSPEIRGLDPSGPTSTTPTPQGSRKTPPQNVLRKEDNPPVRA